VNIEIKKPLLIGVTGYKGSGKDTFAEIIKEFMGDMPKSVPMNWLTPTSDKVHMHAFGDTLKRACSIMYNIPIHYFYDNEKKAMKLDRYPFCTIREVMTGIGTDAVRRVFEDTWVESTRYNIEKSLNHYEPPVVFVTDVRYPNNEAKLIKELGGVMVRIFNPHVPRTSDHSSEALIDQIHCEYGITNNMDDDFWPKSCELFKFIVQDHNERVAKEEAQ